MSSLSSVLALQGLSLSPELLGHLRAGHESAAGHPMQAVVDEIARLQIPPGDVRLHSDGTVALRTYDRLEESTRQKLVELLRQLRPWRKGPFDIHEIRIDAEWRSELKWRRLLPLLPDVRGLHVLDVGCNNGWYAWHLLGLGAASVLGVDPSPVYVQQARALQLLAPEPRMCVEPVGIEDVVSLGPSFDLVLLMGILYHHPDPVQVLRQARGLLRATGTLIIETIVVPGAEPIAWVPESRYAGARGFWYVPTLSCLRNWIHRADLHVVELDEPVPTTADEQRSTEWREGPCLFEGLDPQDLSRTIEGYPAPQRVVLRVARKPRAR
jgi:tRNA (mo5U34)-methyltransferase